MYIEWQTKQLPCSLLRTVILVILTITLRSSREVAPFKELDCSTTIAEYICVATPGGTKQLLCIGDTLKI